MIETLVLPFLYASLFIFVFTAALDEILSVVLLFLARVFD